MAAKWLATKEVRLDELTRFPGNARRGNVGEIRKSIRRHGQYRSLVVRSHDGTLTVLAGNHTADALEAEGRESARCELIECSDDEARRINAADNRLGELPDPETGQRYDDEALAELLAALDGDFDGTGWTQEDLDALLAEDEPGPVGGGDPDSAPDPPGEPLSVPGDVWALGPHRVACGDSTDIGLWDSILKGDRPSLVFTDPPYGIAYANHLHWDEANPRRATEAIANDGDAATALQVTRDALALFHDAQAHFVCCDWRSLATIIDAMLAAAIEPKACIVWDKQARVQNLDRYAKQHEFIVYAGPYGGQPTLCTDVWAHARDFEPDHPTPKPVSLIEQALTTASGRGAIIADPFGGSGSTLIAAHRTGRVARLCELDGRYVDQICERFERYAGITPERVRPDGTTEPVSFT